MGSGKDRAHIDRIVKHGDGYRITGTHDGHKAEFYVHAASIDNMPAREAKQFMKRNIVSLVGRREDQ